jgi:hypothetical protein
MFRLPFPIVRAGDQMLSRELEEIIDDNKRSLVLRTSRLRFSEKNHDYLEPWVVLSSVSEKNRFAQPYRMFGDVHSEGPPFSAWLREMSRRPFWNSSARQGS